ncbi:hypothetical protein QBC42DRAFT_232749 [Cladorrhinum samala]|uniref:NACHT domain-containing protein n=1 Tax=Cladorrhinum samala TaxID=585594 RepID=A0AAV9HDT6_9PEZI|nr:hypothetical protein QBC42DRAFT_232749 [Cladorrhinum samala]
MPLGVRKFFRKRFGRRGDHADQAGFEEQSRGSCDTQPESVVAATTPTTHDSKDPPHIPDADNNLPQLATSPELASSQQIISPSRAQPSPTPPIDSADQESTIASLPVQLWDRAYNELKQEETKLLDAYEKILSRQLQEGLGSAVPESQPNIIAQDKPDMRRHQMTRLIQSGLDKIKRQAKLKGALDKPVEVVLSAKNLISSAIQVVPQAALAWSGICVALEILANPIKQPEANRKGIDYILHRMDWYWSLSNSLFNDPDDPVADLSEVRRELETRIVGLYKALLSYQIKSVCSYFRRSGLTFLRDIIKIDDWDAELGDIKDAEDTFRQDHQAYHHEKNTSQLGELVDHARSRKMQELSREDQQCLKDLHLTNPRDDKSRIQKSKGDLLKDSYRWVLSNPDFQRWRDHKDSQLLWIKGDPGKGKTMLLCGIIDELDRGNTANARSSNVAYFFCQATDSRINYATAVLRGLIYMLVDQQRSLIYHVRSEYDGAGKKLFDDPNAWEVLSRIFTNILQDTSLRTTTLLIDALDECAKDLPQLLDLIAHKSSESSRVKWIVSSRNWPEIEEGLETATQKARLSLELNAESVAAAVNAFIKHKVDQLAQQKAYDDNIKEKVETYLHSHANDTFLWVALVCQALAIVPKASKWRTLEKLETFPSGLDSLYARMLEQINHSDDHELCNQILSVAVLVHRPLSLDEFTSLVKLPHGVSEDFEDLEQIISLCGSFLTIRERIVYFVHQSAKDFLLGRTSESRDPQDVPKWVFPLDEEAVNSKILSSSIQAMSKVLRRDMYGLSALGVMIDEVRIKDPDPLAAVRYSCVYWIHHLCDLISSTNSEQDVLQDDGIIHTFFNTKYLYWLEALSLLKAMPDGIKAVRQLQHQLGNSKQGHLLAMIRDAYRFALSFGRIIEQAPLQAYSSALVFAPTGSLVKKYFEQEVPEWLGNRPTVEAEWDACLQTLEGHGDSVTSVVFSPDGRQVASGSYDRTVKVWDTASGSCVASGSYDRTVKVWDTASGSCVRTLEGHGNWVMSVVFSPDGRQVASGSDNGTVKVWDTASGSCVRTLQGYGDSVTSVVFLLDKAHLNNTTERPDQLDSPKRCLYGIAQDNCWVTCNSQKVLWLPPGYRPITTAIQNGVIAFSYQTGRVLIISFLDNV